MLCFAAVASPLWSVDVAHAQVAPPPLGGSFSQWAFPTPGDPQGRLSYPATPQGDRLCDFSYAGYGGGGVALPAVPVVFDLSPMPAGDDTSRIQDAIDYASSLPLSPAGFRGAVLLRRGTYRLRGSVQIRTSGVVLRGEGRGKNGTILVATGRDKRTLIEVAGRGRAREIPGTRRSIRGRVGVGAMTFRVDDASGFAPGQRVMIHRPSTQEWIDFVGMDKEDGEGGTRYDTSDRYRRQGRLIEATYLDRPWQPGSKDILFDRVITAVSGDQVTVDAPLTTALEGRFGGATIYQFEFPGRITQVGVEKLRGVSDYSGSTDEDHAWSLISLQAVEDGWVRNVVAQHFAYSAVSVEKGSRRVTVQDSKCLDGISRITGGRRYSFRLDDAQLVLMQRLFARRGRHDFVLGSLTPGPNAFLECQAKKAHDDVGPHSRWSSGVLFDQVRTDGAFNVRNRGNMGTGHGWAGASCVIWNSRGEQMIVQDPPGAQNWVIGTQAGTREGDSAWDSRDRPVWPASLYLRQLEERLGPQAVAAIAR